MLDLLEPGFGIWYDGRIMSGHCSQFLKTQLWMQEVFHHATYRLPSEYWCKTASNHPLSPSQNHYLRPQEIHGNLFFLLRAYSLGSRA